MYVPLRRIYLSIFVTVSCLAGVFFLCCDSPVTPDGRVEIKKVGISFTLPEGWMVSDHKVEEDKTLGKVLESRIILVKDSTKALILEGYLKEVSAGINNGLTNCKQAWEDRKQLFKGLSTEHIVRSDIDFHDSSTYPLLSNVTTGNEYHFFENNYGAILTFNTMGGTIIKSIDCLLSPEGEHAVSVHFNITKGAKQEDLAFFINFLQSIRPYPGCQ